MPVTSPGQAAARVAAAAQHHPERLADAYRDLTEANILAEAKKHVARAKATGASPPSSELLPRLLQILGTWGGAS